MQKIIRTRDGIFELTDEGKRERRLDRRRLEFLDAKIINYYGERGNCQERDEAFSREIHQQKPPEATHYYVGEGNVHNGLTDQYPVAYFRHREAK